jgi:hypothetical protein
MKNFLWWFLILFSDAIVKILEPLKPNQKEEDAVERGYFFPINKFRGDEIKTTRVRPDYTLRRPALSNALVAAVMQETRRVCVQYGEYPNKNNTGSSPPKWLARFNLGFTRFSELVRRLWPWAPPYLF